LDEITFQHLLFSASPFPSGLINYQEFKDVFVSFWKELTFSETDLGSSEDFNLLNAKTFHADDKVIFSSL